MKRSHLAKISVLAVVLLAISVQAQDDGNKRLSVTVSFGAGLNTPPASPTNHHVLPKTIEIKAGGVVNFVVAGFHQILVYLPGKSPEDIVVPSSGLFIDDLVNLYYQGIVPAGGPTSLPVTTDPSNARNRTESVFFSEPGTYLVICNVRPHFLNGMFAFVKVSQ